MVKNVVIAVEEEPNREDLDCIDDDKDAGGHDEDHELLGIYRGVPLTERDHDMPLMPDEIAIFRGPINRVARTRQEAVHEVRETVIHELGHYFGLADEEMPH
jgi:predicted Zn-dependent protease with MMP-like domain